MGDPPVFVPETLAAGKVDTWLLTEGEMKKVMPKGQGGVCLKVAGKGALLENTGRKDLLRFLSCTDRRRFPAGIDQSCGARASA